MAGGVVAAVALGLFFGRGSIIVLSFGVFLKDLIKDFHTTRAAISFAFTLHNILGALSTPVVGRLIDAAEERKVILTGTAIFGLVLLSARFVPPRLPYLFLSYIPIGLMACCTHRVDRWLCRTPPHASWQERLDNGRRRDHRVLSGRGRD